MKKKCKQTLNLLGLILLWQFIISGPALAYIDPGTGSYLFQMLMAGLLSSMFAVKMFWRNIRVYFSRFFSQSDTQEHENE
ncbi:MAG: hypothetical protein ACPGYT_12610 [Nitrospirales bacterium]